MKKSLQIFALLFCIMTFAQAPEKFSYQAIVRNGSNALITNAPVGVKISILKTSAAGTVVYSETQTPTANGNGLVSIQIGSGTVVSGTIAGIDWSSDSYYIKTETDPGGGTNYSVAGTTQLLSVPYALYAKNAGGGSALTLPYTATAANTASLFMVTNSSSGTALEGINTSTNSSNVSAIRGVLSSTNTGSLTAGVRGINNSTNFDTVGVWGHSFGNGIGVYGESNNNAGVWGYSATGTGGFFGSGTTGQALVTSGDLQLMDIGEGVGKVLTSDATGNATWQEAGPKVHFSSVGGSSQTISTGVNNTINSWTGLEESGGANYNPSTGEYTIPVTGYYSVKAQIGYLFSNSTGGSQSKLVLEVNNNSAKITYGDIEIIGSYPDDLSLFLDKTFTAGDKIRIVVRQNGRPTNNLFAPATNFSIQLIHK